MSVFPSFIVFIATFELHEIKPRFTSRNAGLWLLQSSIFKANAAWHCAILLPFNYGNVRLKWKTFECY